MVGRQDTEPGSATSATRSTQPGIDHRGAEPVIAPGAELGRYRFLRRVGEGGMGVVYEARDRELGRTVALKVLRRAGGPGDAGRRARLIREAQTMAKLAHAHVVPVFDVGELAGDLFVAMELVDGEDLARWLARAPRPWRDVVTVLLQAARGLEAAHRAGVIHRDFKPSNVMVGRDGRVRVFDFGLARAERDPAPDEAGARDAMAMAADARAATLEPGQDAAGLTAVGAVIGTPAYMAPEQLRGEIADAASDQYAFAVSLREALTGSLPWPDGGLVARAQRLAETAVPPWPGNRWPPRLRRIVDRAMAADPAARFASMSELIAELEGVLAARRRRAVGVALLGAVVIAGSAAAAFARLTSRADRPGCEGGAALLAGAWDTAVADRVSRRLADSGAAGAGLTAAVVRAQLDRVAVDWVGRRRAACEATFVRGEQSERVMALRFACLARRRGELAALSELLASADRAAVDRAIPAVSELPPLDGCDDVAALEAAFPPPRDPVAARTVADVQAAVDRAVAQRHAGQYQPGLAGAPALLARAEATGFPPVIAAALAAAADLENWGGDAARAEALYRRAARAFGEARDDAGLASAWVTLVFVVGSLEGKTAEAARIGEFASTLVARRRDPALEAQLENNLGAVAYGAGELDAAAGHFERALALRRATFGADHLLVANSLGNLGAVRRTQSRHDEATAHGEQALAIKTRLLGPEHPEVASSLRNLAMIALSRKDLPAARALEERAMAIFRAAHGEAHPEVANSLNNLGQTYQVGGDLATAVRYQERALAIYRAALDAKHPLVAKAAFSLAESLAGLGRHGEALALAEESLAALSTPDANPVDRAHAAFQVAAALGELGRDRPRARALMGQARATYAEIGADIWESSAARWLAAHPGPR